MTKPLDLSEFSIHDLVTIHKASCAAAFAWQAVFNMPRASGQQVSDFLETQLDAANVIGDDVYNELMKRAPATSDELGIRTLGLLCGLNDPDAALRDAAKVLADHIDRAGKVRSG